MSKESEQFKQQFEGKAYPRAFTERYSIVECLSVSEVGETLLTLERATNAYCVAKVVENGAFEAERQTLGALSHPGLPALRDWISEGDTHILIRSFVEGTPLDKALSERAMTEADIADIGVRLCDILQYLHTQKPPVIHRDIKPQNVILAPDGNVTLIDFGIARTYKEGASRDTQFAGTSAFAPPEQYGFAQTDARADIYALGMLLKYLLTGGNLEGRVTSRRFRRVIDRCCAFAPRSRYPNALAVKRALLRVDGKRQRRLISLAVAVAAFLFGVALGRYALPYSPPPKSATFKEPVVERAARLALGMPEGALTADDLAGVTELYIAWGDAVSGADAFFAALRAERAETDDIGSPKTLAELALFPNLEKLYISGGVYTNLSGLEKCAALSHLELYNNDALTDISALEHVAPLRYVGLISCNRVQDISPLTNHESLTDLDLSGFQTAYDPARLTGMGDFYSLSLTGNAEAYRYVGHKRIGWLRLSNTGIPTLEPLQTVTGLWRLELAWTPLASLDGIEAHTGLQSLNIAHTNVADLKPLLALPALTELVLSADMDVDDSVLAGMNGLSVRYE